MTLNSRAGLGDILLELELCPFGTHKKNKRHAGRHFDCFVAPKAPTPVARLIEALRIGERVLGPEKA